MKIVTCYFLDLVNSDSLYVTFLMPFARQLIYPANLMIFSTLKKVNYLVIKSTFEEVEIM